MMLQQKEEKKGFCQIVRSLPKKTKRTRKRISLQLSEEQEDSTKWVKIRKRKEKRKSLKRKSEKEKKPKKEKKEKRKKRRSSKYLRKLSQKGDSDCRCMYFSGSGDIAFK